MVAVFDVQGLPDSSRYVDFAVKDLAEEGLGDPQAVYLGQGVKFSHYS